MVSLNWLVCTCGWIEVDYEWFLHQFFVCMSGWVPIVAWECMVSRVCNLRCMMQLLQIIMLPMLWT